MGVVTVNVADATVAEILFGAVFLTSTQQASQAAGQTLNGVIFHEFAFLVQCEQAPVEGISKELVNIQSTRVLN